MRHLIRAVAATTLAAALFASASAAPSTTHLDDLRTFMQTAHDAIPPNAAADELVRRAALTKGLVAFNANSTSLDGDVRMFGKVAAAIQFAGVKDEDQHLRDAIVGLRQDALPLRDALVARIDSLVSPKLAAAARRHLGDINASVDASIDDVGPYTRRANELHYALTTIAATNARISKATAPRGSATRPGVGYFACLLDGSVYVPPLGAGAVKFDTGSVSEVTLTGYFPSAGKGGIEIEWSTGTFTGTGTYLLDGNSGALVVLTTNGQTFYSDGTGGQVTVTSYDAATRRITGTFDAPLVGAGDLGGARTITNGSFDVRRYGTSGR